MGDRATNPIANPPVVLALLGAALLIAPAGASATIIANGSAPPDPTNIVTDATGLGTLYVRNVGCPPGLPIASEDASCPAPGSATQIEYASQVSDVWSLYAHDTSSAEVTLGGRIRVSACARDSASITFTDAYVGIAAQGGVVCAQDSSTVVIEAGTFNTGVYVGPDAEMTINGGTFGSFANPQASAWGLLTVNGGDISLGVAARSGGIARITGGDVSSGYADDGGLLEVSGGDIGRLGQVGGAIVVSGGHFGWYESDAATVSVGTLSVSGGSHGHIACNEACSVSLTGGILTGATAYAVASDIAIDGTAVLDHLNVTSGTATMLGGTITNEVNHRDIGTFKYMRAAASEDRSTRAGQAARSSSSAASSDSMAS